MDMSRFLVDAYFTEHTAALSMGSSDPETLTPADIHLDFTKYKDSLFEYALGQGFLPLREKLATLYDTVSADELAVVNGGEEAIYVTMRSLLSPGDEVLIQTPSYQSLSVVAESFGCRMRPVPSRFESGWRFDIDAFGAALTPATRMMVLNYPHNPTGACLTEDDMTAIVRFCREHELILVSDEAYRFLTIEPGYSTASFADRYENAVALGSFSKTFASPGLRLGWIATKNPVLMRKILAYRHFTSTCTNLPCQWIGSELLDHKNAVIARSNAIVQENARRLARFIAAFPEHFAYVPPAGATMAYVKLLGNRSATQFADSVRRATGVLLIPSSVLEDADDFLRIGLCRRSFAECVRRVSRYLENTAL